MLLLFSYVKLLRIPLLTAIAVIGIWVAAFHTNASSLLENAFDISWRWGVVLLSFTAFLTAWAIVMAGWLILVHGSERLNLRKFEPTFTRWHLLVLGLIAFVIAVPIVYRVVDHSTRDNRYEIAEAVLGAFGALILPGLYKLYERYSKPGHRAWVVLSVFMVPLIFYGVVGWVKYFNLSNPPLYPALAYVLLLLMVLCLLFSAVAFYLDRRRIPLIALLLLYGFLFAWLPCCSYVCSDYFYPVTDNSEAHGEAQPPTTQPSPTAERNPIPDDTIIVVATSGGGIQAAAWTARVLTGLEEELGDDGFGTSLRLISSASGGSVGAMYFANEYTQEGPPSGSELSEIVERTEGSSLDEITWGLTYHDFLRTFIPYRFDWDRGRALEEAWLRKDLTWNNRDNITAGLSEWRENGTAVGRPGLILNTTNTDSGERLPLSTISLPEGSDGKEAQDEFFRSLGSKDISVLTATRLSASFPYVSPAARANVDGDAGHIVDGGYYDNYGVLSLVEWLDAELENGNVNKVLFLQIRGTPTDVCELPTQDREPPPTERLNYERESSRGWFYQAFAPLSTMLHVRDTAQVSRNEIELRLLMNRWNKAREEEEEVITRVIFGYDGTNPPLSWHLTENQKQDIDADWEKELNGSKARDKNCSESSLMVVENFLKEARAQKDSPKDDGA